jgi:pimeloyl-ACP methyl ester carboxylesterase
LRRAQGPNASGYHNRNAADEVAQLLFYEDLKDVVLVGTSYGGMVACRAAELMRERIGRLVFVDALTLFDGQKVAAILPRTTSVADGVTLRPSPEDAATRLFADLDPRLAPGHSNATRCIRLRSASNRSSSIRSGRNNGRRA